jgi:hypothetical protein
VVEGVAASPAAAAEPAEPVGQPPSAADAPPVEPDEGGSSRINLRMPDSLKARVEAAALREGRSVNAWLVRAATAAIEQPTGTAQPYPPVPADSPAASRRGSRRVTGWAQ